MSFVIPPGRNQTLALAWKLHKAAQRAESKPKKPAEPAKKNAKQPGALGGKPKGKRR